MMNGFKSAQKGYIWVLTAKGLEATPEHIKSERKIGEPVGVYIEYVPISWVKNGWVELKKP